LHDGVIIASICKVCGGEEILQANLHKVRSRRQKRQRS